MELIASDEELDIMVTLLTKQLKLQIHRSIYKLLIENQDRSIYQMSLDAINPQIIDLFIRWWHTESTTMCFNIRHLFVADDSIYKSSMVRYLANNECRWLTFFMARTGLRFTTDNCASEYLLNFFTEEHCLDRDILALTFQSKYAKLLRRLQSRAHTRFVFMNMDVAMLILWLYGAKEFHRQYYLQSTLSIVPEDVPSYKGQKLYIIDWCE